MTLPGPSIPIRVQPTPLRPPAPAPSTPAPGPAPEPAPAAPPEKIPARAILGAQLDVTRFRDGVRGVR